MLKQYQLSLKPILSIHEEYITIDPQTKLYCQVVGNGKPVIVLHGGPGLSSAYLQPQLLELTKNYQLIFYDQRASGKSTGLINNDSMQLDVFVQDLAAIQNHFNLASVCLCGHSWGAFLALKYTSTHQHRVDRLILLNPISIYSTERSEPDLYEVMIQRIIELSNNHAAIIQEYRNTFKYFFIRPEKIKELNLEMSEQAAINSAQIHVLFEKTFFAQYDIREELKQLSTPILILYGRDHDLPTTVSEEIAANMPNAQYIQCEALDSGHFSHVEAPPEVLFNKISTFLSMELTKKSINNSKLT
ncbi:MAG: alpha/beta fold hydrolase [Proteobacteria bacterium]|nr:alpha/beta fold hydrolase [Pseudomonadota bacterium]